MIARTTTRARRSGAVRCKLPPVLGALAVMTVAVEREAVRLVRPLAWIANAWPVLGPLLALLWEGTLVPRAKRETLTELMAAAAVRNLRGRPETLLSALLVFAANHRVNVDVGEDHDDDPAAVARWVIGAIDAAIEKRRLMPHRAVARFLSEGLAAWRAATADPPDPLLLGAILDWAHEPRPLFYDGAALARVVALLERMGEVRHAR